jgi:hypothetical protein
MKNTPEHTTNPNPDNNPTPDNSRSVAPAASAGGALTSLTALAAALNSVDTSVVGRSGLPLMQFKSRGGRWGYGRKQTVPEEGSLWAVNIRTFRWGWVAFPDGKAVERMVSVSLPMPPRAELPDTGAPWNECWGVNLKCIGGADAGVEVTNNATTVGGIQVVAGLIDEVRDRFNGGQHDGKVVPIVRLEKDSYQHPQHGRIWTPATPIVDWMPLDGPAPASAPDPAPAPATPAAEQPRRRRVA